MSSALNLLFLLSFSTTVLATKSDVTVYKIPIYDVKDNVYLIDVQVGVVGQNFSVQLDTSSADFWLVDSNCDSPQCKGLKRQKNRFNSSASRTYAEDGHEFLIEYNHRGVQGKIGRDNMDISGITIRQQSFGLATLLDSSFQDALFDGIFGFGRQDLSQTGVKTPLQNILEDLADSSFSIWLASHALGNQPGGLLTFGGVDVDHCESSWTYANQTNSPYWAVKTSQFSIGTYIVKKEIEAVLSTRDSFIAAPTTMFNNAIKYLNAKQVKPYDLFEVPCDTVKNAPDLVFQIAGNTFKVRSTEYIRKVRIGKNDKCVLFLADSSVKGFDQKFVFGDPLLRSVCTNYSIKRKTIGFAVAKQKQ